MVILIYMNKKVLKKIDFQQKTILILFA